MDGVRTSVSTRTGGSNSPVQSVKKNQKSFHPFASALVWLDLDIGKSHVLKQLGRKERIR